MFYSIARYIFSLHPIPRAANGFWLFMIGSAGILGAFVLLSPEQLSDGRTRSALAWALPWAFAVGFAAPIRGFDSPLKSLATGLACGMAAALAPAIWAQGKHAPWMELSGLGLATGWLWAMARHWTRRAKISSGGSSIACLALVTPDGDGADAAKAVADALLARWPELAARARLDDFGADGGLLHFEGIPELWLEMSKPMSNEWPENEDSAMDSQEENNAMSSSGKHECLLSVVWHPDARLFSIWPSARSKLDPMALRDGLCAAMREGFPQFEPRPVG